MKKFIKHIWQLLYFLIFFGYAYNGSLIKIDSKNWLINIIQLFLLLILFSNSFFILDMLIRRKRKITVLQVEKKREARGYGKLFNIYRCFFIALDNNGKEIITAKLTRDNELTSGKILYAYFDVNNKLRVVDKYAILYRIVVVIQWTLLYILIVSILRSLIY
jgi:hypothetical protein